MLQPYKVHINAISLRLLRDNYFFFLFDFDLNIIQSVLDIWRADHAAPLQYFGGYNSNILV